MPRFWFRITLSSRNIDAPAEAVAIFADILRRMCEDEEYTVHHSILGRESIKVSKFPVREGHGRD